MFGISGLELVILVVFVLLIFGPDKMPELARTLGKATKMFKRAQEDMESVIRAEVYSEKPKAAAATVQPASVEPPKPTAAESIWAADEDDADDEEPEGEE